MGDITGMSAGDMATELNDAHTRIAALEAALGDVTLRFKRQHMMMGETMECEDCNAIRKAEEVLNG